MINIFCPIEERAPKVVVLLAHRTFTSFATILAMQKFLLSFPTLYCPYPTESHVFRNSFELLCRPASSLNNELNKI